jgi:MEMO1 family protein
VSSRRFALQPGTFAIKNLISHERVLMTSLLRTPAVAGRFYPGRAEDLLREIRDYTSTTATGLKHEVNSAIGCIAPHAGYIYSGPVAGALYSKLEIPPTCVILCPNHTGEGHPLAIMANTTWQTPLGEIEADEKLARQLMHRFPALAEDSSAHRYEHAIEVQLPFLQQRWKTQSATDTENLRIVPIAIGTRNFEVLRQLGEALAEVIAAQQRQHATKVLIIASSDMNHYESDEITRVKDHKAIDQVLALDARGLWDVVTQEEISMCGFGPSVAMLTAAKLMGAASAKLIKYATSGEVSGDFDSVVGYAGITIG